MRRRSDLDNTLLRVDFGWAVHVGLVRGGLGIRMGGRVKFLCEYAVVCRKSLCLGSVGKFLFVGGGVSKRLSGQITIGESMVLSLKVNSSTIPRPRLRVAPQPPIEHH